MEVTIPAFDVPTLECNCCDALLPGAMFSQGGAGYAVPGTTLCNNCAERHRANGLEGGERATCPACGYDVPQYGYCAPCHGNYIAEAEVLHHVNPE
jgi:hypothetical protein